MRSARKGSIVFLIMILIFSTTIQGTASADSSAVMASATDLGSKTEQSQHWAQSSIDKWTLLGVVKGYEDGSFHPNQQVTRAELATMLNRIFGYTRTSAQPFADVSKNAWYSNAMSIAKEAGYYEGYPGNLAKANTAVSRQDAVTLIMKAFYLKAQLDGVVKTYSDDVLLQSYAREAISALGHVLKGYPDGSFKPDKTISRAEVVKVLDSLVSELYNTEGTFTGGKINNHAIISAKEVTLKDADITGNLYLSAGIGNGNATLENSQIKGTTFVSGGGDNSIHLYGTSLGDLVVQRPDGTVRVVFSKGSSASNITVNSPAVLVFDSASEVNQLTIASPAEGTRIEGTGTISEIVVLTDGVTFNRQLLFKNTSYSLKNGKLEMMGTSQGTTNTTGNGSTSSTGSSSSGGTGEGSTGPSTRTIDLVDINATAETRSLFQYLNEIRGTQVLFGQQHATTESFAGYYENGKVIPESLNSVGDLPAVFGWDTLALDGKENPPGVSGDYEASRLGLSEVMKEAYDAGGIVTLSTHPYNPVTGGNYRDTSNTKGAMQSVVTRILPGGDKNAEFRQYLDRIASFANGLKDDDGKLIPVLFRPFHEQNGSWFWWGAGTTTKSEYVELYRYTVEYLRDVKGVRNFLYVYSPNGPFNGNENDYLTTYPGDEFVDVLGMDQYDNKDNAGSEGFIKGLVKDLGMISKLADRKGKISIFSEYGYSPEGMKEEGNNELQWFTKILNAIKADPDARKIAYMQTWANFGLPTNLFVPYKDVAGKGSHELLPDFIDFYKDPYTSFIGELKNQNIYHRNVTTASERPIMHIVSPTNIGTVTDASTVIRAKISHFQPSKVTFAIGAQGTELEMKLDADGYYSAVWSPDASLNGKTADIVVRGYWGGSPQLEQTVSVFVKVQEILIKQITFDTKDSLGMVQNNGAWPETIETEFSHQALEGDGKLAIHVLKGLGAGDSSWQELKLELTDAALDNVQLAQVKRVKMSALIPVALQNAVGNATIQGVVMLPDDWDKKYGMDTTKKSLAELPEITVNGVTYYKYDVAIDLEGAEALAASGLAISIIGSYLNADSLQTIYVDNIGLYSVYNAPIVDQALVDDYESYDGSNDALSAKYPKANGDPISVELSSEHKLSGDYGMKLDYSIDAAGYAGAMKSLGSLDWSDFNALHLWIGTGELNEYAKEGKPLKLVIQFRAGDTQYEFYPVLSPFDSKVLVIPFGEFDAVHGPRVPISLEGLKKVSEFNIYVNSMDGGSHLGTLYFDDIRVVSDSSLPEIPENGVEPEEPKGHAPGVLYEFKSDQDVKGWESVGAPAFNAAEEVLSADLPAGKHLLSIKPVGLILTGLDTIEARVKLTSGTAKAKLFIQTGDDWKWVDSGESEINSDAYTTLSISLPTAAAVPGTNLKVVQQIGIEIQGTGTSQLLLKDVTLTAPSVDPIEFLFDENIDGWRLDPWDGAVGSVTHAVYNDDGNSLNVLKVDFSWKADKTDPYLAADLMEEIDLGLYSKMVVKVKVESDVFGIKVKPFVKVTSNWTSKDSGEKSLDEDGFSTVIFDLSGIEDLQTTKAIGIQFVTPNGTTGNAAAYIDEVKFLP